VSEPDGPFVELRAGTLRGHDPDGSTWSMPLLALVGVARLPRGPFSDEHVLCLAGDRLHPLPVATPGLAGVLRSLAGRFGVSMDVLVPDHVEPDRAAAGAVLWPEALRGRPFLEITETPRSGSLGAVADAMFGTPKARAGLRPEIAAYLRTGELPGDAEPG